MLFDLRENNFWVPSWGEKPDTYMEREQIARVKYVTYPKLIPIFSHRYLPSRPSLIGNPVLSVYQMYIVLYGYDLPSYLANEFHLKLPDGLDILDQPKREIEFWGDWIS